jgi:multisite-specific tRNA:(cytosine-C5)-methyltransferase
MAMVARKRRRIMVQELDMPPAYATISSTTTHVEGGIARVASEEATTAAAAAATSLPGSSAAPVAVTGMGSVRPPCSAPPQQAAGAGAAAPSAAAVARLPAGFEAYYRAQGVVPSAEWGAFVESLATALPTSFRLRPGPTAPPLLRTLAGTAVGGGSRHADSGGDGVAVGGVAEGGVLEPDVPPVVVEAVRWLPASLHAYVVREGAAEDGAGDGGGGGMGRGVGRQTLRARAPRFHRWLTERHDSGLLTRQELVSMVPPLLLAPQADDAVLDLCAAPGSKTAQLLDLVAAVTPDDDDDDDDDDADTPTAGGAGQCHHYRAASSAVVVANDADKQRCSVLTHQLRRNGTAAQQMCLVVNHDAAHEPPPAPPLRPLPHQPPHPATSGGGSSPVCGYDKVLCDVP